MSETLLKTKVQGGLFLGGKLAQSSGHIFAKRDLLAFCWDGFFRDCIRRVMTGSSPSVAKLIVCNTEDPGAERRVSPEVLQAFVGLQKRFLGQVVGPGRISLGQMTEKPTDR